MKKRTKPQKPTSEFNDIFLMQLKNLAESWTEKGKATMQDQRDMYSEGTPERREALSVAAGKFLGLEHAKSELLELIKMAQVVYQDLE